MNDSETNASSLFELIPPAQCLPHQIATQDNGDILPTFRFLREPSTIDELWHDKRVVSMENGTLVLINFNSLPRMEYPYFSRRVEYSKYFLLLFDFDDKLDPELDYEIFGESEDKILETALFFMNLKGSTKRKMTYIAIINSRELSFNAGHSQQLALLLDVTATKNIGFYDSELNAVLSVALATRPYPINLKVFRSSIDMDVFIEHLKGRSATFGSLAFMDFTTPVEDIRRIFVFASIFEHLGFDRSSKDLVLQLLAAPVKSVCFGVCREAGGMDAFLGEADIVPTDIEISHWCSAIFMHSFLCRIAQLGHVESLKLAPWSHCGARGPAPDVVKALIDVIHANKKLKHFDIECLEGAGENRLADLFGALEEHEELRTLKIHYYPTELDPQLAWLKHLLQRNRQIEITGFREYGWQMDLEMKEICALNRFLRRSPRITRESSSVRLLLMGAALTNSAISDVQRIGILLTDHVDLLCDVLHWRECDGETVDGTIAT